MTREFVSVPRLRRRSVTVGLGVGSGGFAEAQSEMLADVPVPLGRERVDAVLSTARRSGLLEEKTGRISGRISPTLLEQAKRRTGIESDTDLLEFALANLALDDDFAEAFKEARATVDPTLTLGF